MKDQKQEADSINLTPFLIPLAIVLAGIVIALGIFLGSKPKEEVLPQPKQVQGQQTQSPPASQRVTTSLDDDALLGNKETAKVAIIEFSDYECPFCQRFLEQTLDQIKKDYLDTGQAIFVYRDLPLAFHNPAAEREAIAAECAREQGGDQVYYQYHDKIFETTPGNGQGITVDNLVTLARETDLEPQQFKTCLEEEKYKEEVAQDMAEATQLGIIGTPGFVIGKLSSEGQVEGVVLRGARPYADFKSIIDQELK